MAYIETTDDQEWDGDLAELRPQVVDPAYERVDHIMSIHSLDAGSMRVHLELYRQAMRSTKTLRRVDREMIALVASQINECHY